MVPGLADSRQRLRRRRPQRPVLYEPGSGVFFRCLSAGSGQFTYFGGTWDPGWRILSEIDRPVPTPPPARPGYDAHANAHDTVPDDGEHPGVRGQRHGKGITSVLTSIGTSWLRASVQTTGYPERLQAKLRARLPNQTIRVQNQGVPGEYAIDGRYRLGSLLPSSQADLVIILEGVNDPNAGISVSAIADALGKMVDAALAANKKVILSTLTPVVRDANGLYKTDPGDVAAINVEIRKIAAASPDRAGRHVRRVRHERQLSQSGRPASHRRGVPEDGRHVCGGHHRELPGAEMTTCRGGFEPAPTDRQRHPPRRSPHAHRHPRHARYPGQLRGLRDLRGGACSRLVPRGHDVTVYGRRHYVPAGLETHRGVRVVMLPTVRHKYLDTVVHTGVSAVHALRPIRRGAGVQRRQRAVLLAAARRLPGRPERGRPRASRRKWNTLGRRYMMSERLRHLPDAVVTDARVIESYHRRRYRAGDELHPVWCRPGADPAPRRSRGGDSPPGDTCST